MTTHRLAVVWDGSMCDQLDQSDDDKDDTPDRNKESRGKKCNTYVSTLP